MATKTGIDTAPTDYQARLLVAALADPQHRIPADARGRTLDIMRLRQWVRPVRRDQSGSFITSNVRHWVLTHHGVNAAQRVKDAAAQAAPAEDRVPADLAALAERYPAGSVAVYAPEGATEQDVVVIESAPAPDGTVEARSARQGRVVRVPLAALESLPELPARQGEPTDWWTVSDKQGREVARVEAAELDGACAAAEQVPAARAASRRDGGLSYRRLSTAELDAPAA